MYHSRLSFKSYRSPARSANFGPPAVPPQPPPRSPAAESGAPFEFELYQLAQIAIDERHGGRPGQSGLRAA